MTIDDSKLRNKIYPGLVAIQGELCKCCGKLPKETPENKLYLNFKDENQLNEDMSNLQILCRNCIVLKNFRAIPDLEFDTRSAAPEMKKNIRMEPLFRNWLSGMIELHHKIPLSEAINSGAEYVDGSPETIKRYLKKMTSNSGNYRIVTGQRGTLFIKWKEKT